MFEQALLQTELHAKKGASMLVSVLAHILVLLLLLVIPVLYTHGLPPSVLKTFLIAPPAPRAASASSSHTASHQIRPQPRLLNIHDLVSRPAVPVRSQNTAISGPAAPDIGVPAGSETRGDDGIPGLIGATGTASVPPPALEPKKVSDTSPIRVGGHAEEANLIHKVMPVYPPLAKSARVQGSVEFTALISKEGAIEDLQVVHGHPLLIGAAKDAVLQWRYRPTMLNGSPVEVVTAITVNFTLGQ